MGTFASMERASSKGKGHAAEEQASRPGLRFWDVWNTSSGLSRFVERYHSSLWIILPFAVNVGVSPGFAVFCL